MFENKSKRLGSQELGGWGGSPVLRSGGRVGRQRVMDGDGRRKNRERGWVAIRGCS